MSLETRLTQRAAESALPVDALRAVYLRGAKGGVDAGLDRVDAFIVHALLRDTRYPLDRDLVPATVGAL